MKNSTIWISGSILGLAVIYLGQTGEKQIIITAPTVAVVSDIITVKPTKAVAEGMSILKPTEKTQSSVVEASIPTQHLMPESDPVAVDKAFSYSVSIKGDMIDVNIEILKDFATQKESSEICFVENSYDEVLAKHMNIDIPGETIDSDGNVVGTHKGYMHYTIGKRRGFFVDGAHDPHFVLDIKPELNQIVVGTKEKLEENSFEVKQINLFKDLVEFDCNVKVRYRTQAVPCHVVIDGDEAKVVLKKPVFGLAKGQVAAFYDNEKLLGGGVIC